MSLDEAVIDDVNRSEHRRIRSRCRTSRLFLRPAEYFVQFAMAPFTLEGVREIAAAITTPWKEDVHNTDSSLVSFTRHKHRISIFYITGTVITTIANAHGRLQLVRTNVDLSFL